MKAWVFSWVLLLKMACNGTAVCTGAACVAAVAGCVGVACNGTASKPVPPFEPEPSEDVCEAQSKLAQKLGVNRLVMGIMTENS
ncbi:MAG: hypothetical protein FWC28_00265, partial [Proteobacteria bacterium]|nr:hypothetical protein [Pseudomonadota bacterium]